MTDGLLKKTANPSNVQYSSLMLAECGVGGSEEMALLLGRAEYRRQCRLLLIVQLKQSIRIFFKCRKKLYRNFYLRSEV